MADPVPTNRKALAAAWAVQQMSRQEWNNFCERFIENAYGSGGQFPTAAAGGSALISHPNRSVGNPLEGAEVGDLLFFAPDASNQNAGHVGIYVGNGQMVSATPGGVKKTGILSDPYYGKRFLGWGSAPDQWKGPTSNSALVKGAQQLVMGAQQGAAQGQGETAVANTEQPNVNQREIDALQKQFDAQKKEVERLTSAANIAQSKYTLLYTRGEFDPSKGTWRKLNPIADGSDELLIKGAKEEADDLQRQLAAAQAQANKTETDLAKAQGGSGTTGAQERAAAGLYTAQAGLARATTAEIESKLDPQIAQILASAGLDEANAARVKALLGPEIAKTLADTDYTKARTNEITATLDSTIKKALSSAAVDDATVAKITQTLPGEIAQQAATLALTQAQTAGAQTAADKSKLQLQILQQARDEVEKAYSLPPGPERTTALQAATEKYAMLTDPTAALDYSSKVADLHFRQAESLSKQTGQVIDPFTLQPKTDPATGQPMLTAEERNRQQTFGEQQRQTNVVAATSIANQAAALTEAHNKEFLPAEAAAGFTPILEAFSSGKAPQGLKPIVTPAREPPAQVQQRIFDAVMKQLGGVSPIANSYNNQSAQPQGPGPGVPAGALPTGAPPLPTPPSTVSTTGNPMQANLLNQMTASTGVGPAGQAGAGIQGTPGAPALSMLQQPGQPALAGTPLEQLLRQYGLQPGAARAEAMA